MAPSTPLNFTSDVTTSIPSPISQEYVGFVSDPSGRGTISLVLSCLITLVLCVWSALHLNVPKQGQTTSQALWLYARWIVTGIYAPELVVFTAWRQWSSARILTDIVHQEFAKSKKDSRSHDRLHSKHTWTMTHGFLASTGGLAFETRHDATSEEDGPMSFLPPDCPPRMHVTARGVAFLAKCGHLPDISEDDIKDKSKASALAKALVLVQAAWMLIQVCTRLAAQLPVTLLEINTVAHALCAFLMYAMWWRKPLLIKEPIILNGSWVPPLLAYMYMSSEMSGKIDPKQLRSQTLVKTLFAELHLYAKTPEIESITLQPSYSGLELPGLGRPEDTGTRTDRNGTTTSNSVTSVPNSYAAFQGSCQFHKASRPCLEQLKSMRRKEAGTAFFERRPRLDTISRPGYTLATITANRLKLAAAAIAQYPEVFSDRVLLSHRGLGGNCTHFRPEQLVAPQIQNWPWDDLLRDVDGFTVGMILWLANLCYGCLHVTAWNNHFPSDVEKWMWRASSTYIGFCGGLWVLLNFLVARWPEWNDFWESWMDGKKKWWHNVVLGTPVIICGFSFIVARAFIITEALLSLRSLPLGAYQTPSWIQIFPHF